MIQLSREQYLPTKYFLYIVIKIIALFLAFVFVLSVAKLDGWTGFLFIFFALPAFFYAWFEGKKTSFQINESKIAISSGIVAGRTKTIPYSSIKNIKVEPGILRSLMGLATVSIWTASTDQRVAKENKPDGQLCLDKDKAKWLAEFIVKSSPA